MAPVSSSLPRTFFQLSRRLSSGRRRARGWGRSRGPSAATKTRFGSFGSTRIRPICRLSERPIARPGLSAVGGPVHAVAVGDVRAHVGLARADVEDLRVRRRDRDRSDRGDRLAVEDRLPGAAGVLALPDSAADRAEVEVVRLARHARRRDRAPAAERADHPPVHPGEERRVEGLRRRSPRCRRTQHSEKKKTSSQDSPPRGINVMVSALPYRTSSGRDLVSSCHPERSEGSAPVAIVREQILRRFAPQDDKREVRSCVTRGWQGEG